MRLASSAGTGGRGCLPRHQMDRETSTARNLDPTPGEADVNALPPQRPHGELHAELMDWRLVFGTSTKSSLGTGISPYLLVICACRTVG
jgi:hypothetical protein